MPRIKEVTGTGRDGVSRAGRRTPVERIREANNTELELRRADLAVGSPRFRFLVSNHARMDVEGWARLFRIPRRLVVEALRLGGVRKLGVQLRDENR